MPQVAPAAAPATAARRHGRSRDGPSAERGRRDSRRDGRPPADDGALPRRPAPRSCRRISGTPLAPVVEHAGFPLIGNIVVLRARRGTRRPPRVSTRPRTATCSTTRSAGRCPAPIRGLFALVVMPLAMSLEILAEAAAYLVPGRIVTGMRDVRAYRWLSWEDAPRTLELRARRLDAHLGRDRVHVELRPRSRTAWRRRARRSRRTSCSTTAIAEPPPRSPRTSAGAGRRAVRAGPALRRRDVPWCRPGRRSAAIELLGARRCGREARGPATGRHAARASRSPASSSTRSCSTRPGQVIGFWAADRLDRGTRRLPVPTRRARRLRAAASAGGGAELRRRRSSSAATRSCAPTSTCYGAGRRALDASDGLGGQALRRAGPFPGTDCPVRAAAVVDRLAGALAAYSGRRVACRRLDARLPIDRGLWKPVWAQPRPRPP